MKPRGRNREKSSAKPQQRPFRRPPEGRGEDAPQRDRRDERRSERPRRDVREQRRERAAGPPSPFGGDKRRERSPEFRDNRSDRGARRDRPDARDSRPGRDGRNERRMRPEREEFRGQRSDRRETRAPRSERPERGTGRDDSPRRQRPMAEGPRHDRSRDDRPRSGKPRFDRPKGDRPGATREQRAPREFPDRRSSRNQSERRDFRERAPKASAPAAPPKAWVPRASQSGEGANAEGAIVVSRRGAQRLRSGNPWVYRSDVLSANAVEPGGAAPVLDDRGKPLGTALYSSASQIALRMISNEPVASNDQLLQLVRERVKGAIAYRDKIVRESNACRLIFSEADLLPGLIVDRYNDVISVQVLTQAMDREDIRAAVVDELVQHFQPAGVLERVEPRIRELEQLPPRESALLHGDKSATTFTMNGLKFAYDGLAGQKTGAFLDQRENYAAAAQYAHGEAIDVFCYQGGFALHLARVCDQVAGVDVSRPALEIAEQNATANSEALGGREIEWIEANAFDLLRDYSDAGQQYDTIVLDPPAFAKSHKNLETALRGYKELNLRALKMLRPGGVLVTCSCSFHVSEADFMQMLAEAAADAHRSLRIVEKRIQAKDHPVLLAHPESLYLKCVIAMVE